MHGRLSYSVKNGQCMCVARTSVPMSFLRAVLLVNRVIDNAAKRGFFVGPQVPRGPNKMAAHGRPCFV